MKEKVKDVSAEMQSLIETIYIIQEQLKEDEMLLLQVHAVYVTSPLNQCFQKATLS